ncbi:MAG TPA: oligosaccharide flippase family protein, partial [Deltaproteobacteria bacterium]|nr:oligosaccharide flippase family protein [Deltaproteobacteria bacterium]
MSGITLGSARLLYRSLDVVRILTIARWLGPDEMGVYAVATLIITALEQISQTGLHQALIQRQGDISSYLLPVRTIQALRGIALGLLVYVSAPVIAGFFNSPKSLEVLRIMALYPVITGFEPLAVTLWQRELQFTP